ncbi:hypothetical protein BXZ70DRAFT_904738 [Cristinia sonorae]|uniref:DUF6699 domain-containing protein n=1 Tax=Cristinia sonorae TaxID=1940300 RepID=A0A8K0UWM2_9AGAR|nr:hypothetical protein BXZ70DRAFT_904738 [Cristinia sonorae]
MSQRPSSSHSKRVHWADVESDTYDPPRTPSPTYSHSSGGSSSPGPWTPPKHSTQYLQPEYDPKHAVRYSPGSSPKHLTVPVSPQHSPRTHLRTPSPGIPLPKGTLVHSLLISALHWDLTQPVDDRMAASKEPATKPPFYEPLSIIHPDYMWSITVTPRTPGSYVTVGDVFKAISDDVKRPVTHPEYEAMATSTRRPHMQLGVDDAFSARCARNPAERQYGVRRVDFFQGATRWGGLRQRDDGRVELILARF